MFLVSATLPATSGVTSQVKTATLGRASLNATLQLIATLSLSSLYATSWVFAT
jgi:hypothetical protein